MGVMRGAGKYTIGKNLRIKVVVTSVKTFWKSIYSYLEGSSDKKEYSCCDRECPVRKEDILFCEGMLV